MLLPGKIESGLMYVCMLLTWMVIYSFGFYFVFRGSPPTTFVAMKDIIVLLFIGLGVGLQILKGPLIRKTSTLAELRWFVILFAISLLYAAIDIQRAGNLVETVHGVRDFLMPLLILLVGFTVGNRRDLNLRLFVNFVSCLALPILILGIYEHFCFAYEDVTRLGLVDQTRPFFLFLRTDVTGTTLPGIRAFGVFDSPLSMALFCILSTFNAFVGWKWNRGTLRYLNALAFLLSVVALEMTYTRAGLVALALAALMSARFKLRTYLFVCLPMAILMLAAIVRQTRGESSFDPSTVGHLLAYSDAYSYLYQKPLGYGASFAGTRVGQVPLDGDYLNIVLNFGPLGLVAFVYVYIHFYVRLRRIAAGPELFPARFAARGAIASYLIVMLVLMIYPTSPSWMFNLWLGVLLGALSTTKSTSVAAVYARASFAE
jgi:hypothetical protein